MPQHFLNLTCHLESADSVRTSPANEDRLVHFPRMFAEAFVHILVGEQLRLGQTPLYDSHGMVQFLGELLAARDKVLNQQETAPLFFPLVMTHYKSIKDEMGQVHPFESPTEVLRSTFAINTSNPRFINSALPRIGGDRILSVAVSEAVRGDFRFDVTRFPTALMDQIAIFEDEVSHLENLSEIDTYFLNHPELAIINASERFCSLGECLKKALGIVHQLPMTKEMSLVVQSYKGLLATKEKPSRSETYAFLDKHFADQGLNDLAKPARELADSLYMYNEALVAQSLSEITSSGVESQDEAIIQLGNDLSRWADETKKHFAREKEIEIHPNLQLVSHKDLGPLNKETFRKRILEGLAAFVCSYEFRPLRQDAIRDLKSDSGMLHAYWEEVFGLAENHPALKGLIDIRLAANGAFSVTFSESPSEPQHVFAAMVPASESDPENIDKIRDLLPSTGDDASASISEGSDLDLG